MLEYTELLGAGTPMTAVARIIVCALETPQRRLCQDKRLLRMWLSRRD